MIEIQERNIKPNTHFVVVVYEYKGLVCSSMIYTDINNNYYMYSDHTDSFRQRELNTVGYKDPDAFNHKFFIS